MKRILCRAAAAAFLSAALAGTALARDDEQLWASASASAPLGGNWRINQEVITRFSDNRGGLYEVEAVSLLGYKLGKSVTFAAGYVHNPQYSGGDFTVMERRAREQLTFDNLAKIGRGKLGARLRLEQRWRENADGTAWRARPYVKYSLPLRKGGKTSLTFSNELFVNLKNTSFQRSEGIDRMRNLVAVSTPLSKRLSIEAGYLNQYGFVRGGDDTVDHAASISLGLSL